MKKEHWSKKLESLNACSDAVMYARTQSSLDAAWKTCKRGDWMLWLLAIFNDGENSELSRKIVGTAAECAALALPIYETYRSEDACVRDCLTACNRYAAGEVDAAGLRSYTFGVYDAGIDASDTSAANAAYAAAQAANTIYSANAAAAAAMYAANATDGKDKTLARCADIVRTYFPNPPSVDKAFVRAVRGSVKRFDSAGAWCANGFDSHGAIAYL